jgi:hypothetical protein
LAPPAGSRRPFAKELPTSLANWIVISQNNR